MMAIVLHLLAALAYGITARLGWKLCRAAMPASTPYDRLFLRASWLALLAHAAAMVLLLVGPAGGIRLGAAPALSLTLWLAGMVFALEQHRPGSIGMRLIHATIASPLLLLVAGLPITAAPVVGVGNPALALHLVVALMSYALFAVAAFQAIAVGLTERLLHRHRPLEWLERLPSLMVLERQLFHFIALGFLALTLTNASGILFAEQIWHQPLRWDHKTVFSLAAWLVFGVLLFGRWRFGWRGSTALRLLWAGFAFLILAYVGTHFVLDVILRRPPAS